MNPGQFTRQRTLLFVALTVVDSKGRLQAPMVGGQAMQLGGHRGPGLKALAKKMLQEHPASLDNSDHRKRCAVIGGDGAIVQGQVEGEKFRVSVGDQG